MKIKCDYCDSMIEETEKQCPHCGAPLSGANRTASSSPQTIEQLKAWYKAHNLPPEEVTRFFIGRDVREPKAFGIYKNTSDDFVVYKNKSDGSRAIRYQGKDETYAVNELYQRLRSEIEDQIRRNNPTAPRGYKNTYRGTAGNRGSGGNDSFFKKLFNWMLDHKKISITIFIVIVCIIAALCASGVPRGYYSYNGRDYYRQGSDWYYYDNDFGTWHWATGSDGIYSAIDDDNYSSFENHSYYGDHSFEDSIYYDSSASDYSSSNDSDSGSSFWSWFGSDDDDDWDSDWSWDSSDSWDSDWGGSDWDSDW